MRQHGGRGAVGLSRLQYGYLAVFVLAALFGVVAIILRRDDSCRND